MMTLLSLLHPKTAIYFIYMLQQVEYNPLKFWGWLRRLIVSNKPIKSVMHRKTLVYSFKVKLLLSASVLFLGLYAYGAIALSLGQGVGVSTFLLLLFWLIFPLGLALFLFCASGMAYQCIVKPQVRRSTKHAKKIFKNHNGVKIAVLGSYGKTTMKELLANVSSSGTLKVAATPGNMNVSMSHARFARTLKGDEDVVILEFGEGEPGDIARMADMFRPDWAIVTGLAPNHLDFYPDITAVAADLLTINDYITDKEKVVFNGDSPLLMQYVSKEARTYSSAHALGWSISEIVIDLRRTSFTLASSTSKREMHITSGLIGRHQVGPLALCATLAEALGESIENIEKSVAATHAYDHRMQPRALHGAWVIDDTYNGNIEGMKVGLRLLSELEAKRKWYVTPGLVDQGSETERVHEELGEAIANAQPDIVVLMENSVRPIIEESMKKHGFSGELRIEQNPLEFYMQIEHLIANGDLVLLQNDWTDNYN